MRAFYLYIMYVHTVYTQCTHSVRWSYHNWNILFINRYILTSISCCLSWAEAVFERNGFGGGSMIGGFAARFPWFIWDIVCKLQCILFVYWISICSICSLDSDASVGTCLLSYMVLVSWDFLINIELIWRSTCIFHCSFCFGETPESDFRSIAGFRSVMLI